MRTISWADFGKESAVYDLGLPVSAWGSLQADIPAPVELSAEVALRRFSELPAGPIESDWHISLDLSHGVKLEDSDDFYSDDHLTTSEVIRRIEDDLPLASDLTWDLG